MSNESAAAFINKLEGAPPAFEGYGGVTRQTARRSTGGPFVGTAFGAAPRGKYLNNYFRLHFCLSFHLLISSLVYQI